MTKQELISYVRDYYSVDPDYPWEDENYVLRHLFATSGGSGITDSMAELRAAYPDVNIVDGKRI